MHIGSENSQEKIKLSVVSNFNRAGAERQAHYTVNGLIKRHGNKIHVDVIGYSPGTEKLHEQHFCKKLNLSPTKIHDINDHDLDFSPYLIANELGFSSEWAFDTDNLLRNQMARIELDLTDVVSRFFWSFIRTKPDVVYLWQDYMNTAGGLAALLFGAQNIVLCGRNVSPDNMQFNQPFFLKFYKLLLNSKNVRFVCNSEAGIKSYAKWLNVPKKRFNLLYNAYIPELDNSQDNYIDDKTERPTIIGVFMLRIEKDPSLFLSVIERVVVHFPNLLVYHLGDGLEKEKFKELIDQKNLNYNVRLIGAVDNVTEWMKKADLLLHTALTEGLPNVFLEAQSVGLPVICTDAGGTREAIIPGVTGINLKTRDPELIAQVVIQKLLEDKWRIDAASAGKKFISDKFSEKEMIAKTYELLCGRLNEK